MRNVFKNLKKQAEPALVSCRQIPTSKKFVPERKRAISYKLKKTHKRLFGNSSFLIVLLSFIILLTACTSKTTTSTETSNTPLNDTLRIYSYAPDTLNPILTQNRANREMLNLVFEPLIWVSNSLEPIPILATEWSLSEDGLTWTVQLRPNVTMHDGSLLTTSDVLYSLNIAKTSTLYASHLSNVDDMQAVGNTIKFRLNSPQPNFINMLEIPIIRSEMHSTTPIGTGPFTLDPNQIINKTIDLTAFSNWWNPDKPYIRNVIVRLMPDDQTSFFSFGAREIDIVDSSVADLTRYTIRRGGIIRTTSTSTFNFLALNHNRTNLSDVNFRRAISYAINKEQLASDIFGGRVAPTNTFINPNWSIYSDEPNTYEFNVSSARDILEEWEGSRTFEILVNSENENRIAIATFISNSLREVGIDARVRTLPWQSFENAINNRQYDAFIGAVSIPNDANATFLLSATSSRNFANFASNEMQETVENWQKQTTPVGQQGGYHFIQQQYLQDLPFISLFFEYRAVIYSDILSTTQEDFTPLPNNIFFDVNYWKVAM